jgi:hypothetical protein
MKVTSTLYMIVLCLLGYAQPQVKNRKVSIECKNQPLSEVMNMLSKSHGVQFYYSPSLVPVNEKITIKKASRPLHEVLVALFDQVSVETVWVGAYVILKKKSPKYELVSSAPSTTWASVQKIESISEYKPEGDIRLLYLAPTSLDTVSVSSSQDSLNDRMRTRDAIRKRYLEEKLVLKKNYDLLMDSLEKKQRSGSSGSLSVSFQKAVQSIEQEFRRVQLLLKKSTSTDSIYDKDTVSSLLQFDSLTALAANNQEPTGMRSRKFAVSAFPGFSTNGLMDSTISNSVSLNLPMGRSAGVYGVEAGILFNTTYGEMRGAQFCGIFNDVSGTMSGAQFAGIGNNCGPVRGFQAAGLFNTSEGTGKAVQAAGIFNLNKGVLEGVQLAGIVNVNTGYTAGVQAAGVMNIVTNHADAVLAAGIVNVIEGDNEGVEIAGLANLHDGAMRGTQVAGLINTAHAMYGTQIGLINLADTIVGFQIGLFNFADYGGYQRFEVGANDVLHLRATYKMGVEKWYTLLGVGAHFQRDRVAPALGGGFGSVLYRNGQWDLAAELMVYHIGFEEQIFRRSSFLHSLSVPFQYKINKQVQIHAGPVLHVHTYDKLSEGRSLPELYYRGSRFIQYESTGSKVDAWIGFQFGVTF